MLFRSLDKVRTAAWREARKKGVAKKGAKDPVKGARWALLKNEDDLTAGQKDESLAALANTDPKGQLYRAWQLKELLRGLLGRPIGRAGSELKHWVFRVPRSHIPEIVEPAGKIRRRRPDILRTIGPGYPNARLEAFDNGNKVTVRVAYGFHHVTNLISLIMLRCGGLDIRLPEPVS